MVRGLFGETTRPQAGSLQEAVHTTPKFDRLSPARYGRISVDQQPMGRRDTGDFVRLDRDLQLPQGDETTPSVGIPQKAPCEIHGDELLVAAARIRVRAPGGDSVRGRDSVGIGTRRDSERSVEVREPVGRRHRPSSRDAKCETRRRHATAS